MCAVKSLILLVVLAVALPELSRAAEEVPATALVIQAEIPQGGHGFLGFGFDSLWTVTRARQRVQLIRINAADNSVVEIELNSYGSHRAMGIGEGAVWVAAVGRGLLLKVDPIANKVVQEIEAKMLDAEGIVGVGEGGIWVLTAAEAGDTGDRNLTRYNPQSGAIDATIPLPSYSAGVVVDFGSVWVTGHSRGELYRIDPKSNTIVATRRLNEEPRFIASGEGSIWVLNQGDGTVQRIDGKTGELLATIETGLSGIYGDIACGGGYVWVSGHDTPVAQIDPKSNALIRKFIGGPMGNEIRYGAGSLWLSAGVSGPATYRIEPPK
jgi:streptogramin lyase